MTQPHNCPICYETSDDLQSTLCGHVFCRSCYEYYIEQPAKHANQQCPMCRRSIDDPRLEDLEGVLEDSRWEYDCLVEDTEQWLTDLMLDTLAAYSVQVVAQLAPIVEEASRDVQIIEKGDQYCRTAKHHARVSLRAMEHQIRRLNRASYGRDVHDKCEELVVKLASFLRWIRDGWPVRY